MQVELIHSEYNCLISVFPPVDATIPLTTIGKANVIIMTTAEIAVNWHKFQKKHKWNNWKILKGVGFLLSIVRKNLKPIEENRVGNFDCKNYTNWKLITLDKFKYNSTW